MVNGSSGGVGSCREKKGGILILKKGPWTPQEDNLLLSYIQQHGHGSWQSLPSKAGLKRCGKSCRLRWNNYLRPDIKRGKFSVHEEHTIIQLHALLGNKWSTIASHLPKRTDNEIKNYWNTHLKKRLEKMGIDPTTHKPKIMNNNSSFGSSPNLISHIAQWESARLEAEARLVRQTSSFAFSNSSSLLFPHPPSKTTTTRPPRPKCLDVLKAWQGMVFGLESPTSIFNFSHNNSNNINNNQYYPGDSSGVSGKSSFKTTKEQIDIDEQVQDETLIFNISGNDKQVDNYGNENEYINEAFIWNTEESEEAVGMVRSENIGSNNNLNVEDNYWNSLLSLVDTSLSTASASPFFF